MRRFEVRAARSYWHASPTRTCLTLSLTRRLCRRCLVRGITGRHRRDRAAWIARMNQARGDGSIPLVRRTTTGWERVDRDPPH